MLERSSRCWNRTRRFKVLDRDGRHKHAGTGGGSVTLGVADSVNCGAPYDYHPAFSNWSTTKWASNSGDTEREPSEPERDGSLAVGQWHREGNRRDSAASTAGLTKVDRR